MCDSITNGGYIPVTVPACPPSNVIIASNVLSTTGNVLCANIISGDGTFTGNLLVTGTINGLLTFAVLNVSQVINTNSIISKSYIGNGSALSSLNTANLFGLISTTNLPLTGVTAGLYGSSANVSQVTIDQYGRVTTAANVAILSSQWTTVAGNVAYAAGVSIGTLAAPPVGSNLYVLGTANMTTLNVTTLFANSSTIFGSKTLNVFGISNLNYIIGDGGGISNVNSSSLVGTIPSSLVLGNALSNLNASNLAFGNIQGYVVYGNTLSNIQASNITQPFANLVVSNTVTTNNVAVGNTLTVNGAMTSNIANTTFFYDTFTIPYINSQVGNITTLNVSAASNLSALGVTSLNVSSVSNLQVVTLTGTTGQTTIYASGNIYASNAVSTTNVIATTVSSTNPIPFRNRIINGGMTIWQRNVAAVSTTAGIYTTADRWCGALGTSGLILSQWPGPTENLTFPYSLQVTTSNVSTGVPLVEQHIEYLNIPDFLNGTAVSVSFYAGQSYGTLMPLTVGLYYATAVNNFGVQTLAVAATKNTPTLTASNVQYSLSFTLTTALAATNGLSLRFTTGAASALGSTFLLSGVQVEKGLLATPFEIRPYASELALCQRYYYQITSPTAAVQGTSAVYAVFGTATGVTTTAFWVPIQFPVPMRNPYYTFTNSAVSNFHLIPTGTTTITSVGIQSDSYTPVGATLNFVGTNIVATASYIFRTNNLTGSNVAFFGFSCEL